MFKTMKRTIPIFAALIGLLACQVPALAAETGSIDVTVKAYASDEAVSGGTLNLYKVANVMVSDTGEEEYVYTSEFMTLSDTYLTADNLALAETANVFADRAGEFDPQASTTVDATGYAGFTDLNEGLYLITQGTAADGFEALNPFVVSMPLYEDGVAVWNVDATPKTTPVTKKTATTTQPKTTEPKTTEPKTTTGEPKTTTSEPKTTTTTSQTPTSTSSDNTGTKTSTPSTTSTGDKTSSTSNVKTGDIVTYTGIAACAAAVAAIVILAIKRRRAAS